MRTPVSPLFRNFCLAKYPALSESEPWRHFFHYLCFGSFFDEQTHQLVLPTKTISEKFFNKPYQKSFNGQAVLEAFRDAVLPDLAWSEHTYWMPNSYKGRARRISCLGFDAEMQEALRRELLSPSEKPVDFVSGKAQGDKDRYQEIREATEAYEQQLSTLPLNATQRLILDYLRALRAGHLLLRKLNDNEPAIQAAIDFLPPVVQEQQRRILAAVRHNPNVYYLPSERGHTCRLSAQGESILGLKSSVRKAATHGWWECDLRSSQFAILAAKLAAPRSQALIESGESLWRSFYRHTHGFDADPPKPVKDVFKETIYSIAFGKSMTNLAYALQAAGMTRLMSHPIVQELLGLRKKWFAEIKQSKGSPDAWGNWLTLDPSRDPETGKRVRWEGAVAAAVIQSIEMDIIAPIFQVANEHGHSDQFTICLFQHDGATVSFNSTEKTPRAQAKLKNAVETRAKDLGVRTVLEFTPL
jgi:hypothetical protein